MMGEEVEEGSHLEKKTAKGVKKHLIKKKLRHQQYYDCLLNPDYDPRQFQEKMVGFRTFDNQIYTTAVEKLTLTACDDKLYVLGDRITALPYGHRSIALLLHNST